MTTLLFGCGRKNTDENLAMENLPLDEVTSPAPEDIEIHEYADFAPQEIEQVVDDQYDIPDTNPHPLKIVFLGETNLDAHRNETGIAYLVGEGCDATVYNLSISGSTVAAHGDPNCEIAHKLNQKSLVGVSKILAGKADAGPIGCTRASAIMSDLNMEEIDYIVIMYCAQDFLKGVALDGPGNKCCGGIDTFAGALREAIENLKKVAPRADIILVSPFFSWFFNEDNEFLGNSNDLSNGHAYLFEYAEKMSQVASEYKIVFANAYNDFGIGLKTLEHYLEDGIHLSDSGRKAFAEKLIEIILNHEMTFYN